MDEKEINLANLMLEKIKETPDLEDYIKASEIASEEGEINLSNLFYYLDQYYSRAATVKSVLDFLSEEVGVEKTYCILILAIEDDKIYRTLAKIIKSQTEGFLVARAKTQDAARTLYNYFCLGDWTCGMIFHLDLPGDNIEGLIRHCMADKIAACVIGTKLGTFDYIRYLSLGIRTIVEVLEIEDLEGRLKVAILEMFMEN